MTPTRLYVRRELRDALADADTGFNRQFAALATTYGVAPDDVVLDFSDDSNSFAFACLTADQAERLRLKPPFCLIYTGVKSPQAAEQMELPKSETFSGLIAAYVVVVLRFRDSREVDPALTTSHTSSNDLEALADAVEDAIEAAINVAFPNGGTGTPGIWINVRPESNRVPCELYGDGYGAEITLQYSFQISV